MVTVRETLDTRRRKLDGTYPVRIRVTFQRKQKYYSIEIFYTEEDYYKICDPLLKGKRKNKKNKWYKEERDNLDTILARFRKIVSEVDTFSYYQFEAELNKRLNSDAPNKNQVFYYFEEYIRKLRSNEQIGTADHYKNYIKLIIEILSKVGVC